MIENPFKKYAPDVFNKIVLIDTVVDLLEKGIVKWELFD